MDIISPESFKNAFVFDAKKSDAAIVHQWDRGRKDFTTLMRGVMADTAAHLQAEIYNRDYYGLDCIFYSERDVVHFPANQNIYVKFITVAIELENDIHSTAVEMNKLQLFNAPLKVLVTYPKVSEKQLYLDRYSTIIKEADILQDFSTQRKQLVAFGTTNKVTASWTFHVYGNGGFHEI